MHSRNQLFYGLLLFGLLAITYLVYRPGLGGTFVLDDFHNLKGLANLEKEPSLQALLNFVTSGAASSLGRPLTLLTFAPQYHSWPFFPEDFKYVNLMIHLLNGCLLFWLLIKLTSLMTMSADKARAIALICSALWLLHPLQVSTTLYVIQRMAELGAFFVFFGILAYLHGRSIALAGGTARGYAWMSLGIGLNLVLGVLSKENAVLLPLFVAVIELTLLKRTERPPHWRYWALLFIVTPLALLAAYIGVHFEGHMRTYQQRDFTLTERLLSESRILFDYLRKLFLPRSRAFAIDYDDYPVSRGLFDPPVTLLATLGITALLLCAFITRRKHAVLAFAILWFFAAHLLESTFIPLELYFEHRNYIAIAGPLFAICYYGYTWCQSASSPLRRTGLASACCLIAAFFIFITWQETKLWGDPVLQAATWAFEKPGSRRAQYGYADTLLKYGEAAAAAQVYQRAARTWPVAPSPLLAITEIHCYDTQVSAPAPSKVMRRLKADTFELLSTLNFLDRLIVAQADGRCESVPLAHSRAYVMAALRSPYYDSQRAILYELYARASYYMHDILTSLRYLEKAYQLRPRPPTALSFALQSVELGNFDQAIMFLSQAQNDPRMPALEKWHYRSDLERLRIGIAMLRDKSSE